MNTLSNSFIALANGIFSASHHLVSATTIAVIVVCVSLAWLARIDADEMNRKATKPAVGIH
jgi:hypothetical protein